VFQVLVNTEADRTIFHLNPQLNVQLRSGVLKLQVSGFCYSVY